MSRLDIGQLVYLSGVVQQAVHVVQFGFTAWPNGHRHLSPCLEPVALVDVVEGLLGGPREAQVQISPKIPGQLAGLVVLAVVALPESFYVFVGDGLALCTLCPW